MTIEKDDAKATEATTVERAMAARTPEQSRRDIMSVLLGGLGVTALSGCLAKAGDSGESQDGPLGEVASAVTGTTNIKWVDNVTSLRAWNPGSNSVAILEGYSAGGDGGEGVFVWSIINAADNGGTIFNLGGSTGPGWRRICSGPLNVKWFGAKGNNSGDDTSAIQSAINALGSSGGSVYLPHGVYNVSSTIIFKGYTTIFGDGMQASTVMMFGEHLVFGASTTHGGAIANYVTFADLGVQNANSVPTAAREGICVCACSHAKVVRCSILYHGYGIHVGDPQDKKMGQYVHIEDCEIGGNQTGIFLDAVSNAARITGGRIYANSSAGIATNSTTAGNGSEAVVISAAFESPGGNTQPIGVWVRQPSQYFRISQSYFEGHVIASVQFDSGAKYNTETNNLYSGSGDFPIDNDGSNVQPGARIYNSSAIPIPTGAYTTLSFDSVRFDSNSIHSAVTPTRLTCNMPGLYQIAANVEYAANSAGSRRQTLVQLTRGGSSYAIAEDYRPPSTSVQVVSISTIYQLRLGDYLELLVYQDSGASLNIDNAPNVSPEFMMVKVG